MTSYVYTFKNRSGVPIYVGVTDDFKKRMRQHSEKAWFSEVASHDIHEFHDRAIAEAVEAKLIGDLKPRYNMRGTNRKNPDRNYVNRRREWASIQETAEYIGVTERTVRQMIADGRLNGYRNGKRLVRLDLVEVDAAMRPMA